MAGVILLKNDIDKSPIRTGLPIFVVDEVTDIVPL